MSSLITVPAIAALGAGTFAVLATRCAMSRTSTPLPQPSPKGQAPENIVVLGGGYAGSQMAREIASKVDPARFNVILINEREYHVHFIATLRMIVTDEGKLEETSLIPYTSLFASDNGQLKIGKAVAIEKRARGNGGDVLLESGEKLAFRYLVLATGSKWEGPLAFPNDHEKIFEWVHDWRRRFADANDIVIVGGGAVGTELAGELRDVYPSKKITIVHGGKMLVNETYPEKFRVNLEESFRARNVEIVLGDYVDSFSPDNSSVVTTRLGRTIKADLVVRTPGSRPDTAYLKSLGEDILTEFGRVKIRPTLQLNSHPEIFAVGDILDFNEQKQAAKVPGHVDVVATNILSVVNGKPPVKEYKGTFEAIFITNGKNGGVGYLGMLWGLTFGNWVVKNAKSKTLFVPKARKSFGFST